MEPSIKLTNIPFDVLSLRRNVVDQWPLKLTKISFVSQFLEVIMYGLYTSVGTQNIYKYSFKYPFMI